MLWTGKYQPKTVKEVVGQKKGIKKLKKWLKGWEPGGKAALLYGPPGNGKTAVAYALANDLNYELVELNASDFRGKEDVKKVLGHTAEQASLFKSSKLILIDECLGYDSIVTIKNSNNIRKVKLGELVEDYSPKDFKVLSLDQEGKDVFVNVTRTIKTPHNNLSGFYSVKLHNRTSILVTGNHLLLTPEGWRPVHDLKRGDMVLAKLPPSRNLNRNGGTIKVDLRVLPCKRERETSLSKCSEAKVIRALSGHQEGLRVKEINKLTGLRREIIYPMFTENDSSYISLTKLGIVEREEINRRVTVKLRLPKDKALEILKREKKRDLRKKRRNRKVKKLKNLGLVPLKGENSLIIARLVGHLFGDGSFTLTSKTKCACFSGREEDVRKIKSDIESLGFYVNDKDIRHHFWKNGEVWSITSCDRTFLPLLYSLEVPLGKKTDCRYSIPKWVLKSNKNIKRAFLSSLFGSDGSKPSFQNESVKPIILKLRKRIDLKDNLKDFLYSLSDLLAEFRVESKVKINLEDRIRRKDGSITIKGVLSIDNSMKNIINFLENIGYSYCAYKEILAKKALKYLKWRYSLGIRNAHSFARIPYFKEWLENFTKGESAYYFIHSIKKIDDPKWVYCLTTENGKFLANNVVVHNCDGISGRSDRGGVGAVIDVIRKSKFPVILTANDPWKSNLRTLRKGYCKLIKFGRVGKRATKKRLKEICGKEGIEAGRKVIKEISDLSGGDLRAGINNLQAVAEGKKKISKKDLEALGYREQKEDIFNILKVIFKTHSPKTAFYIIRDSNKSADELFWWIEQNIPKEYEKTEEVVKAYDALSKADIYLQRIRKRQHWRFKMYANQLMSSGVAVAKKKMYHKFTRYYPPGRLKRYGRSKAARSLRDRIAGKIAKECHTSKKQVRDVFLPYVRYMFKKNEQWAKRISESLGLSPEEVNFLS